MINIKIETNKPSNVPVPMATILNAPLPMAASLSAESFKDIDKRLSYVKTFIERSSIILGIPIRNMIFRYKKSTGGFCIIKNAENPEEASNLLINSGYRRQHLQLRIRPDNNEKHKILNVKFKLYQKGKEQKLEINELITMYRPALFKLDNEQLLNMFIVIEDNGSCNFSNITDIFLDNDCCCEYAKFRRTFTMRFKPGLKQPKIISKILQNTELFVYSEEKFILEHCDGLTPMPIPLGFPNQTAELRKFEPDFVPSYIYESASYIAKHADCRVEVVIPILLGVLRACIGNDTKVIMNDFPYNNLFTGIWGLIVSQPHSNTSKAIEITYTLFEPLLSHANKKFMDEYSKTLLGNEIKNLNFNRDKAELAAAHRMKMRLPSHSEFDGAAEYYLQSVYFPEDCYENRLIVKNTSPSTTKKCVLKNANGLCVFESDSTNFLANLMEGKDDVLKTVVTGSFHCDSGIALEKDIGNNRTSKFGSLSYVGACKPRTLAKSIQSALDNESSSIDSLKMFQMNFYCENDAEPSLHEEPESKLAEVSIKKLLEIADAVYRESDDIERKIVLTPSAEDLYSNWLKDVRARTNDLNLPDLTRHFYSGFETIVPTLATIFKVIQSYDSDEIEDSRALEENDIKMAINYAVYLESHTLKILDVDVNIAAECAQVILKNISKLDEKITVREVAQKGWIIIGRNSKLAELGILLLVQCGFLYEDTTDKSKTQCWRRNEYLHESKLLDI
jgi:hypothetical protein